MLKIRRLGSGFSGSLPTYECMLKRADLDVGSDDERNSPTTNLVGICPDYNVDYLGNIQIW